MILLTQNCYHLYENQPYVELHNLIKDFYYLRSRPTWDGSYRACWMEILQGPIKFLKIVCLIKQPKPFLPKKHSCLYADFYCPSFFS